MRQKNYMTYGMAAKLSLAISVVLYTFITLSFYFRELLASPEGVGTLSLRFILLLILFGFVTIFILLFLLFSLNFRILRSGLPQKKKIAVVIAGSVAIAVAYSLLHSWLQSLLLPPRPEPGPGPNHFVWVGIARDLFLATIVAFISQILYLNQKHRQVELRNEALESENIRTRYQALKGQVNPHFLFNTLSTLDAMVEVDPVRSREYIQKFSSVFRYTLKNNDAVTLREELDFVRNYADLMQIRHGENLQIRFTADRKYDNYLVVPMAVQGLIENAIKHNAFSDADPLLITIETTGDGSLVVSNRYQPREHPEPGEGVGLANLAERYRLKWQREITIGNSGGVFTVSLPLIPPPDNNTPS